MSGVTYSPKEVRCTLRHSSFGFRDDTVIAQFIKCSASIPRVAHPQCGMKIADAAWTLLYVWLLEAHRGAIFCVPRSSLTQNGGGPRLGSLATLFLQCLQEGIVNAV